jgi:hypothetical protein
VKAAQGGARPVQCLADKRTKHKDSAGMEEADNHFLNQAEQDELLRQLLIKGGLLYGVKTME